MKKMKTIKGHIVLVQEERFRLLDVDGRSFLFDLAHNATAGSDDLKDWTEKRSEVTVRYEGEPELETGIARLVYPS